MNEQNLIPNSQRTPSELREQTRKGGIASGVKRRQQKALRELANYFGTREVSDKDKATLAALGVKPEMMTRDMQIVASLYGKAMKGDVAAFNAIRDIKGEKPTDELAVNIPNSIRVELVESPYKGYEVATEEENIQP